MSAQQAKNLILNILLSLTSLLVLLLCFELIFRAFDIRGYHEPRTRQVRHILVPQAERLPGVRIQFKPYSEFGDYYDSNPRGYFNEMNGVTYSLNKDGFRGSNNKEQKATNTKRVIIIGDSFTFGEGVKLEDTFCVKLQEILNDNDGSTVEVLNFGMSAWGTSDEINFYAQKGIDFAPDLTLIVYVLNDADYAGGLDLWENFRTQYERRKWRHSHFISYFYATVLRRSLGRKYIDEMTSNALQKQKQWNQSFSYLLKGKLLSESINAHYAVIVFPFMYELNSQYPFRSIHNMIRAYTSQNDIPMFDLLPSFHGQPYTALWVHPSDQHPNEKAHDIAAHAIAEFIVENELL